MILLDELSTSVPSYAPIVLACLAAGYYLQRRRRISRNSARKPIASPLDDVPGEWRPREFSYPEIASKTQSFTEIKEIPYRPFRPGAYHVQMGIRSMPWNDWIELDNQFERYHAIRKHRIRTRGDKLIRVLRDDHNPLVRGGALAAIELVHELAAYLVARYPADFSVIRHHKDVVAKLSAGSGGRLYCNWGWEGAAPIKTIAIVALQGESYELPLHVDDGDRAPERALEIASLLVQDDLALMIEGKDGRYYFQAGSVLVPGFWRLEDKIGLPLEKIHTSGDVPQYREKLQPSMDRFFRKMQVDKPVSRNNYFLQVVRSEPPSGDGILKALDPDDLAWSPANGSEDAFKLAHAFDEEHKEPTVAQLRLRTERQTLRRLPISGAIFFTIRVYLVPITQLAEEQGVAERLASALHGWPEDVKDYKGVYRGGWWDTLLEFLEDKKREGHEICLD